MKIIHINNADLLPSDFSRLVDREWLNDSIMNSFLYLMDGELVGSGDSSNLFMSTYFSFYLLREKENSTNIRQKNELIDLTNDDGPPVAVLPTLTNPLVNMEPLNITESQNYLIANDCVIVNPNVATNQKPIDPETKLQRWTRKVS
jgi:hypothetical protein